MDTRTAAHLGAAVWLCSTASPSPGAAAEVPTWARDVAPIVLRHCAACHQADGPAPFALTTYEEARLQARLLAEVTASGFMPPWLPEPGPAFAGERRLQAEEIAVLARWSAAGAPAGDLAAAPAAPAPTRGWRLGEPDLVVEMPEPYLLAAGGADVFRSFVLPVGEIGAPRRWVETVELLPGDPRVVHHATLLADATDSSRRLDAADPAPGFDGMRTFSRARAPDGHLVGWTPGKVPFPGASDLAWALDAGTDLVLELHLLPSGREETVRARVGLHFAPGPPARRPLALRLGSKTIDIAAGEAEHRVEDRFRLPVGVEVLAVYPHAHHLCRRMTATALLPDGRIETLLEIRRWDFDWQDQYHYREPVALPAGTELRMEYVYDNSAANARNPHHPPRRVVYGPSSGDEMGDLWLQVVASEPADFDRLARALDRRESEANVAGWRAALGRAPDDATLRFNLGSELVLVGALDQGIVELERAVELDPGSAAAHTNLGNALIALAQERKDAGGLAHERGAGGRGDLERAAAHFERAVAIAGDGPEAPDALFNLANTLAALGRFDEAHRRYDRALELAPRFVAARLNKAIAFARQGRPDAAVEEIERCLDVDPTYVAALWNLAVLERGAEDGVGAVF
ncbi:MAG TPA: tetratricopeptide repeat protein, partial [Thermoanaerobaculia bacterium]|nr:tetratricopeptide repeat protein [Thermoanaerobaculia bacterium]